MQGDGVSAQAVAELCEAAALWALVWRRYRGAVLPALPTCESQLLCVQHCRLSALHVGLTHTNCMCCDQVGKMLGSHGTEEHAAVFSFACLCCHEILGNTAYHSTAQHSAAQHSAALAALQQRPCDSYASIRSKLNLRCSWL